MTVADRLRMVTERVRDAARRSGRDPALIKVVAIGKGQPAAAIEEALECGHRVFGENRAQELVTKVDLLPADVEWHFVGALQTNKARLVRPRVSLLHSMDRDRLARVWRKGLRAGPSTLMQVNIGREPQKSGVSPELVLDTFERWEADGLSLAGLMAIPPQGSVPEDSRPFFARMRKLRDEISARVGRPLALSMGMTDDFEVAVEEGSTIVRVGRAIFGPRN